MSTTSELNKIKEEIQQLKKTQELIYSQLLKLNKYSSARYFIKKGELKSLYRCNVKAQIIIHNISDSPALIIKPNIYDYILDANSHIELSVWGGEEIIANGYTNDVDLIVNVL